MAECSCSVRTGQKCVARSWHSKQTLSNFHEHRHAFERHGFENDSTSTVELCRLYEKQQILICRRTNVAVLNVLPTLWFQIV